MNFFPLYFMCGSGCCGMSPKKISRFITRIFFGLALIFVGIVHYKTAKDFATFTSDGLGPIAPLGMVWGYILPALMIIGGILFVIGMYAEIATWTVGIALGSIAAGVLLKSVLSTMSLGDTMPGAVNAFSWIVVYLLVSTKSWGCGKGCGTGCGCGPKGDAACATGCACKCGCKDCTCCKGADDKKAEMMK